MATKSLEKARKAAATSQQRSQVQVCIGQAGLLVGDLTYARNGRQVAGGPDVGMTASEMDEFALAFERS